MTAGPPADPPGAAGEAPAVTTPRVTAIGGGHGLARTLTALTQLGLAPTAIVSVADDGGSSGRLRRDFGTMPPGDLRRALSTLVRDPVTRHLLEHRFTGGDVDGHALGNLLLLGAADIHGGDLARGLDVLSTLLGTRGTVVPAASEAVDLDAVLSDGTVVHGQGAITATPGVRRVALRPDDADAAPAAVAAVADADLVVVGPGSWFTSVLPPLLLPGLATALATTSATTVLVANLREQPGETTGLDMDGHLEVLFDHLPDDLRLDVLVADSDPHDQVAPALVAPARHPRIGTVVTAPLADPRGGHDPVALGAVLAPLVDRAVGPAGPDAGRGA